jgi:alpha-L-fucosidase 2
MTQLYLCDNVPYLYNQSYSKRCHKDEYSFAWTAIREVEMLNTLEQARKHTIIYDRPAAAFFEGA